ncbi:hypothetical protein Rvan_1317 [Rhodomicrobium vannielii ATCC 17100]|jgi:hypothetical protein|uniref:Uncharacterized protein n=1 Tax=Rhodomicrobium vannielii (strain ATCC 17100 / DSM 162 / LMG 4299 / NCIMB 10020 / ATH 3.1.1) TaxID=648757 RepID=E3I5Y6_RHOVT|nr:hypothetical protein Rvan_1317 [Rhodomicrobium vannielii ATCC 17100]
MPSSAATEGNDSPQHRGRRLRLSSSPLVFRCDMDLTRTGGGIAESAGAHPRQCRFLPAVFGGAAVIKAAACGTMAVFAKAMR